MAKRAQPIAEEQAEATDLVVMATINPVEIFTDREQYSVFYKRIKAEVEKHVPDVSTEKGRAAVRKLAFSVTKAKTTLEKAALALTEDWRKRTALVNASRNDMVGELGALAAEVRRPLTEWEEIEEARVERCRRVIDDLKRAAVVSLDDTSATVRERGKALWETEIGDEFGDMADEANEAKAAAIATLQRAVERLTKEEEDRAELERLRAADAERQEREAREQEEREQAERDRVAAEEEEQRRKDAAEAEERRIEEAAERAREEAREKADREHQAELDEANRQREEAQRREYARSIIQHITDCGRGFIGGKSYPYPILIRELEDKVVIDASFGDLENEAREHLATTLANVREAFERDQQKAQERADQEARNADREHRAEVIATAAEAITKLGIGKRLAEHVVRAIVAGEVPAVTLRF